MGNPLIAAIRQRYDLKESVLHTAQEIAARTSIWGVTKSCALSYMAVKCHCSKQTIINHIKLLIALEIMRKRKTRVRGSAFHEINVYVFILPWKKAPAQTCNSQNPLPKLPPQEIPHDKFGSLQEEIAQLRKGLQFCEPGSEPYEAVCDKIAYLTMLLEGDAAGVLLGLREPEEPRQA